MMGHKINYMNKKMFQKFENSKISKDIALRGGASNMATENYIRTTYVSKGTDAIKEMDGKDGATIQYVQYY